MSKQYVHLMYTVFDWQLSCVTQCPSHTVRLTFRRKETFCVWITFYPHGSFKCSLYYGYFFSNQMVSFAVIKCEICVNFRDSYFFPSARLIIRHPWSALLSSVFTSSSHLWHNQVSAIKVACFEAMLCVSQWGNSALGSDALLTWMWQSKTDESYFLTLRDDMLLSPFVFYSGMLIHLNIKRRPKRTLEIRQSSLSSFLIEISQSIN